MIKFLVESGMDINRNEGVPKSAPIAHAASEGEIGIVEYLFNKGAILDVGDPNRILYSQRFMVGILML